MQEGAISSGRCSFSLLYIEYQENVLVNIMGKIYSLLLPLFPLQVISPGDSNLGSK